ncbi:MAG: hypothetical protein LBG89_00680 [Rickettsiales bacterium]|jgi:hypothetical protein|nr:hypothetical protein [Rickettsiales bacterium]
MIVAICSNYELCPHFAILYKNHRVFTLLNQDIPDGILGDNDRYENLIKNKLVLTKCLVCNNRLKG